MSNSILAVFRKQAEVCRTLASPFTASVLEGFADVIDRTTRTGARVLDWPSDEELHLAACHPHGTKIDWIA